MTRSLINEIPVQVFGWAETGVGAMTTRGSEIAAASAPTAGSSIEAGSGLQATTGVLAAVEADAIGRADAIGAVDAVDVTEGVEAHAVEADADAEDLAEEIAPGDLEPLMSEVSSISDEGDQRLLDDLTAARESGNPARIRAAEHAVVLRFLPVSNAVARRYRGRGMSMDDLQQQARLGLVQAVSRWQPNRGVAFLVFALPTMQGMIKRYFRDTITVVRRPRSTQENGPRIQRSISELSQRTGRVPNNAELATHAGVTPDQLRQFQLSVVACNPLPLDDLAVADRAGGGLDQGLALIEQRRDLGVAWGHLSVRERRILTLRFWDELSQAQIGEIIGVTQTQVGRLISRAFAKLSAQLEMAG